MPDKSINHVFAENLRGAMTRAELTQEALAKKSGVSQKTISNYLNPDQRKTSAKGKPPSAKLTELEMIAGAIGVAPALRRAWFAVSWVRPHLRPIS